jgi:oxygen-independent coproporphyrinogen-3 oxidase
MLARLVEKGRFEEASDELCERQYSMLCEALVRAGYHHYEISNFAQPGYEAVHNSAYWKHIPYVGFGPGAHSFSDMSRCQCNTLVKRPLRQWNRPDLQAYIVDPLSVQESEILDDEQLILEKIMLALRTSEGINAAFLEEYCDPQALARAIEGGSLVRLAGGRIRIPESRFFVSDSIIADIV